MRATALSIAGLDPSGGAGLLADIKTFEQIGVQGHGVCSALTFQRADHLEGIRPISLVDIIEQLEVLLAHAQLAYCKVGMVADWDTLAGVVHYLHNRHIRIILDPVLRASSGYEVHANVEGLHSLWDKIYLITPNFEEMKALLGEDLRGPAGRALLGKTHIFLKGGHNVQRPGTDYLFKPEKAIPYPPEKGGYHEKHGSGCILSAAIAAYLAMGNDLERACFKAKAYTAQALASSEGLLAIHKGIKA